tara:strand:- start:497 stop:1144 length:648 start_codon:yes stop_codon:yes gene_type:complete
MKRFKIILSLFFVAYLMQNCNKTDDSVIVTDDSGMGILTFGVTPIETSRSQHSGELLSKQALCSRSELKYVRLALKDSQGNCFYGSTKTGFHELEMDPLGLDTNDDTVLDTWHTSNNHKLQLPAGNYTLEYLAVTNKRGKNSKIILMAPKKGEEGNTMQYYNLVSNYLPVNFTIREGLEHYIPLETLCFNLDLAYAFGFVFLDYEDPNPFYLCSQ